MGGHWSNLGFPGKVAFFYKRFGWLPMTAAVPGWGKGAEEKAQFFLHTIDGLRHHSIRVPFERRWGRCKTKPRAGLPPPPDSCYRGPGQKPETPAYPRVVFSPKPVSSATRVGTVETHLLDFNNPYSLDKGLFSRSGRVPLNPGRPHRVTPTGAKKLPFREKLAPKARTRASFIF